MSARVHVAVVEEVEVAGLWSREYGFAASCLTTGVTCDALAFTSAEQGEGNESAAIKRAVDYLSDPNLHDSESAHFCAARHVLK